MNIEDYFIKGRVGELSIYTNDSEYFKPMKNPLENIFDGVKPMKTPLMKYVDKEETDIGPSEIQETINNEIDAIEFDNDEDKFVETEPMPKIEMPTAEIPSEMDREKLKDFEFKLKQLEEAFN